MVSALGRLTGTGIFGGVELSRSRLFALRQVFKEGVTLDQAQVRLRDLGQPTRRQTISELFRQEREIISKRGTVGSIRQDFRPGRESITLVKQKLAKRFEYRGVIRFSNAITGEAVSKPFNFASDDRLTRRQIQDRAQQIRGNIETTQFFSAAYEAVDDFVGLDLEDVFQQGF